MSVGAGSWTSGAGDTYGFAAGPSFTTKTYGDGFSNDPEFYGKLVDAAVIGAAIGAGVMGVSAGIGLTVASTVLSGSASSLAVRVGVWAGLTVAGATVSAVGGMLIQSALMAGSISKVISDAGYGITISGSGVPVLGKK